MPSDLLPAFLLACGFPSVQSNKLAPTNQSQDALLSLTPTQEPPNTGTLPYNPKKCKNGVGQG
jgi:hypothetical protein